MKHRNLTAIIIALTTISLVGCGPVLPRPKRAASASNGNPLGGSYLLVPLPSEDPALLGRVLKQLPEPGRALEEIARPNPCADELEDAKEVPSANQFEFAEELAVGGKARAMLGNFGFSAEVERATHFVYKLETQKRVAQTDTSAYVECCKEKGCGYGFISALIYGEGEYSTGQETSASGSVNVLSVASAGGTARLKILNKRKVKGWLAVLVTITDDQKRGQLGPLGTAASVGITESTVGETVKKLYEKDKLSVKGSGDDFVLVDGRGEEISENAFVARFSNVTGSDELDELNRRRNTTSTAISGGLTALGLGTMVAGILMTSTERPCEPADYPGNSHCTVRVNGKATRYDKNGVTVGSENEALGWALAISGGAVAAGFGSWFIFELVSGDGGTDDHYMTDREAVLYVEQYNRALLRKTVKDVQKSHKQGVRGPSLRARLNPTGAVLEGRF